MTDLQKAKGPLVGQRFIIRGKASNISDTGYVLLLFMHQGDYIFAFNRRHKNDLLKINSDETVTIDGRFLKYEYRTFKFKDCRLV